MSNEERTAPEEKYNRYSLVVAAAKCARIITDEYVLQREHAEKLAASNKDTEKKNPYFQQIPKEYRDEKAVKTAITGLYKGDFKIIGENGEDELLTSYGTNKVAEPGEFPDEEEREETIDNFALDANTPPKKETAASDAEAF
ncbi:MAG: hypothetical protein E7576_05000 [Ruminococcaceae bacterium]|jgi:hypothetical protein|nr:hypothetical protein [Oscillospiraceae bacterium]